MLKRIKQSFEGVPAIYIDGALYSGIIIFGFLLSYFSSDEAEKWVSPIVLFYIKGFVGLWSAWFAGMKMFRSNAYSQHQEEKKIASGQTEVFTRAESTTTVKEDSSIPANKIT